MKQYFGNAVKFIKPDYDEEKQKGDHALGKALSALKNIQSGIVIGADTIVICNKYVLGKPGNASNTRKMLELISGKIVKVITSMAVINVDKETIVDAAETTHVKIKKLSKKDIDEYIKTKEPFDKAGAFAIQGHGALIVEWIKGDYNNVVGLPIYRLNNILKEI